MSAEQLLTQEFGTLADVIREQARDLKDKPALIDARRTITYAELDELMEEIISHVSVWTAIAESDLVEGERVSLEMRGGLLYANKKENIEASGIVIASASEGEDVGISDLRGLRSLEEGRITLCKVPRVQAGGSRGVDLEVLKGLLSEERMVGCLGIEALVALRKEQS